MKLSMSQRSRRWVLGELDRSAAARFPQTGISGLQAAQDFGAHSDVEVTSNTVLMRSDNLTYEHGVDTSRNPFKD